ITMNILKAHGPIPMRSLAYASGFQTREVRAIIQQEISNGSVIEFTVEGGGREKNLIASKEMSDLKAQPREPTGGVRVMTLYDPLVQHHRVELRRRFGDSWYYPIFDGSRCAGMIEMWEMSGCIDIRELVLDDASLLPALLKSLDDFSWYYKKNLMGLIRFKRALGKDVVDLEPEEKKVFLDAGFQEVRDWLVKGKLENFEISEEQLISYLLWKQHVLPDRNFATVQEGLETFGAFRSDEAAVLRCKSTIPLKKLHKLNIVAYGQIIPKLMTYALHDTVALHKAALNVKRDEQMEMLITMFKEEGHMKWRDITDLSPLGYRSTQDTRHRLTAGLILLRDSENRYYLTPDSEYTEKFARKEVIRRIFLQFGIFSAEMLGYYAKGEFRMFELRTILQELEDEGFLVKGYFLGDRSGPRGYSDSLHWMLKEDVKKIQKRAKKCEIVITPRDNLMHYLIPMVQGKFGMGSSWMIISEGRLIAAAMIKASKTEHVLMKFRGLESAMPILKDFSSSLGKRFRVAKEKIVDNYDDVEDWYEKYTRPGG
ncbi:MAG: crosslink repair DNA glycosylase YcaQ family protein, partial [Thermoplasmata archaeon]|nr:crosslink repair DNA glycosylase YcaQ family protein [Thermoplasmata archaeon]